MSKSIHRRVTNRSDDSIGQIVHALAAVASTFPAGSYRWGSPQVRGVWLGSPGQVDGNRRSYVGRMSFVKALYQRHDHHHLQIIYNGAVVNAFALQTEREAEDEDYEGLFQGVRFDPFFPIAGLHQ